ncbi:hypothetical protein C8T65DRAFT_652958 [Cerioporus squamosus]|nr:hypothetical protein C8T65DRAFT_652958 [Cerioporus squamosus]
MFQYAIQAATVWPVTSLVSCEATNWIAAILTAIAQFVVAAFTAQRAYALSGGRVWLGIVTFFISNVACVVNLLVNFKWSPIEELPSPIYCIVGSSIPSQQLYFALTAFCRLSQCVVDLLVVIVTWRATYQAHKTQPVTMVGRSLASVILYDGSIYAVTLLLLNVVHVSLTAGPGDGVSFAGIFTDRITSIIICHFILDLRRADYCRVDSECASLSFVDVHTGRNSHRSFPELVTPFAGPIQPSFLSTGNLWDETDLRGTTDQEHRNSESAQPGGDEFEVAEFCGA